MIMMANSFAISSSSAMGRVYSSIRTTGRLRIGTCSTNLSTGSTYPKAPVVLTASLTVHGDSHVCCLIAQGSWVSRLDGLEPRFHREV